MNVINLFTNEAFYSYMERLHVHSINVTSLFLSIIPAGHKLVYVRQVLFVLPFCFIMYSYAHAQSPEKSRAVQGKEVSIGHSVPKDFWTRDHLFFINGDTVRKSLSEYKDKMIVLDFWFSGCTPCMLHQNKIQAFVKKHPEDLVVLMVNSKISKEGFCKIKGLYDKGHFERFGITNFVSIIEDDYLQTLFPYTSFPHFVWINNLGRLQLRTFRNLLDTEYVAPFIDARP